MSRKWAAIRNRVSAANRNQAEHLSNTHILTGVATVDHSLNDTPKTTWLAGAPPPSSAALVCDIYPKIDINWSFPGIGGTRRFLSLNAIVEWAKSSTYTCLRCNIDRYWFMSLMAASIEIEDFFNAISLSLWINAFKIIKLKLETVELNIKLCFTHFFLSGSG